MAFRHMQQHAYMLKKRQTFSLCIRSAKPCCLDKPTSENPKACAVSNPILVPTVNIDMLQVMYQLSSTARQLEEQKAMLEGQRRAHLAWSGQAMVSNSLNVMQEAVETIRAAFLLPQKDLRYRLFPPASTLVVQESFRVLLSWACAKQ